jgi:hypothetical protein
MAADSFNEPQSLLGWQPAPNKRGTVDILWSCLTTLFLCTWTVIHLDISPQKQGLGDRFWRRTGWMIVGVFAPELITGIAMRQFLDAYHSSKRMHTAGYPRWSITHSFYVHMGGFRIERELFQARLPRTRDEQQRELAMLLEVQEEPNTYVPLDYYDRTFTYHAAISDAIPTGSFLPPRLSRDDITELSKAGFITKGLTCMQASWLLLQCIGRIAQRLPVTTLEVTTASFVLFTFSTYAFWWHKPFDTSIQTPVRATLNRTRIGDCFRNDGIDLGSRELINIIFGARVKTKDRSEPSSKFDICIQVVFVAWCSLFGAVHCLAWNEQFPTSQERLFWRISSLISTITVPCIRLAALSPNGYFGALFFLLTSAYIGGRCCLLIEAFTGLRALPKDAFKTVEWSDLLPHI